MAELTLTHQERQALLAYQRDELTEHHIYTRLARTVRSPENRAVLERIAADELRHSRLWACFTGQEVRPNWLWGIL
jgi:hypothetical protein